MAEEKQQLNEEFRRTPPKPPAKIISKSAKLSSTQPFSSDARTKPNAVKFSQIGEKPTKLQNDDSAFDSEHSMLLDFVTERSNTICDDINRCRNEKNNIDLNQTRITALHELLDQVNSFRRILCKEIKQNKGDISRIDASQFMTEIKEKQQEIMNAKSIDKNKEKEKQKQKQNRERELSERERLLKMKETCIDEKVRELYLLGKKMEEKKKNAQKEVVKGKKAVAIVTPSENESFGELPVRIVINVNKNEQNKPNATDVILNDMKWSEHLKNSAKENIEMVAVSNTNGKIYPKTPAKSKVIMMTEKLQEISSESTTMTAYFSPPDHIQNKLITSILQHGAITNTANVTSGENPQMTDTQLLHYIIRMLGMSRSSIEQLNMSSISTVKTPNSSVINVSSNRPYISSSTSTPISQTSSVSMEQVQSIDKAKLKQLARFLAENNELGSKMRKDSKESGTTSGVWDEILSKKNEQQQQSKSERTDSEKPKPTKSSMPLHETETMEQDPDEKLSRDDLIAKYDELAQNCTKRIINIDAMISKVREDKLKILENTLSSASSLMTGQKETGHTEYLEYPDQNQQPTNQNTNSTMSDSKGTNAPSSDFSSTSGTVDTSLPMENRTGLFATKNKVLGESKDSGVGFSRPVTSSDYRDSPDLKQNSKNPETESKLLQHALRESKQCAPIEEILKDIPKINRRLPTVGQQLTSEQEQQRLAEPIQKNHRDKGGKMAPPPAMAR